MKLFQKAASFVKKAFSISDPQVVERFGTLSDTGEPISEKTALRLSTVWSCVNLIAGQIGSLPLTVYREKNGEKYPDKEHNLYRVLQKSPNAEQNSLDFWEFLGACVELHGNSFAQIHRSNGRIISLEPILPSRMTVRRNLDNDIEYSWLSYDGRPHKGGTDDIFHVRGFGGNPLGGLSTLSYACNSLSLGKNVSGAVNNLYYNGLKPSGALSFNDFLTDDKFTAVEKRLNEKFSGAHNAGRPMILEGGSTWETLSINADDAQLIETWGFSVEELCRFFGVPPFLVFHTEKSTSFGSGIEQQTLQFLIYTLRRRLKRFEKCIDKQLLTPADRAAGISVEFNMEALLRADSTARASFYGTMLQNGVMTINEVRKRENLPPVAGGDIPRMQMQNVPITMAGSQNLIGKEHENL